MANETKKLEPIELSRLPVIENPLGYWFFGSKTEKNGTLTSGRYSLDNLPSGLIYQSAVNTITELTIKYPKPEIGWAALVKNIDNYPNGVIFSWNGNTWINTGLLGFPSDVALRGGSTLTIQELVDHIDTSGLTIVRPGDIINKDGKYLFFEDGTVYSRSVNDIEVPLSDVNIRGFIAPNGTFNYNAQYNTYSRTDKRNIPAGAISVSVKSLGSTSTTPIAFYNSEGAFISSVANTELGTIVEVPIPSNATQYALTKHDILAYACIFLISTSNIKTIDNKNAIRLIEKIGDVVNVTLFKEFATLPKNLIQISENGDIIKEDGKYLLFEDGAVLIGEDITEELSFPASNVNISGFIGLPDGTYGANTAYNRMNKTVLPSGYRYVRIASLVGIGATPIAFYNSDGTFISSVTNTFAGDIIDVPIPADAVQYALTRRIDGAIVGYVFECTFFNVPFIENKDAIMIIEKKGDDIKTKILREFPPSEKVVVDEKVIGKVTIADMTLTAGTQVKSGYQIVASNVAVPRQVYHPVYTTIERMLFDVSFTVSSANVIIQIGKGFCYIEINGNQMSVYKINDTLTGSTLVETITLPFSLNLGIKYNIKIHKVDGLNLRYVITYSDNQYEKLYTVNNTTSLNVVRAWGNAFFGVKNGTVVVNSATVSTGYDEQTQVSFWGDSFLDAGNLLGNGGKWTDRYCDLVAQRLDYRKVPIMARTGHLLDTAFVTRFKAENSYFKSKYVFMAMGTNNTTVSGYTTYIQQCINEAKANSQIPVLVTITPRVGVNYETVTKVMNDWIKASGEKYVDICAAVTDGNGVWKPQYITSDSVHPTVAGELAMFRRIMIDIPELFY